MTTYTIPAGNWTIALADAIEQSVDGDVIVVDSDVKVELGQDAKDRMCPEKRLTFEVRERNDW